MIPEPLRVLLVEDNPGDIRLFEEALLHVPDLQIEHIAHTGKDLRETLTTKPNCADLIFMDINLPDECGFDLLAELKTDKNWQQTPILILSGSKAAQDIQNAYQLGANSYLHKPPTLEGCISMLKSVSAFWGNTVRLSTRLDQNSIPEARA